MKLALLRVHAKHLGIPWDGPLTPESNSLPGLPAHQWSARSWEVYVVGPTMLRPGRPCSAATSAMVTTALMQGRNYFKIPF